MLSPFSPLKNVASHTLSNGLRVLLLEDHVFPLVSVQGWVHVGSVDEQPSQAGIAHVIEHMAFKGTTQYKAAEISRWVEAYGGGMNAETSKEYTHYYIDVPSAGASRAVSILGELMHRALFEEIEWKRECPVILEEIKRRNDDPEAVLWEVLNEALFQEERLKRPVIGSVESVASQTRDSLYAFYRDFYRSEGSLIIIAGDFNSRQMLDWIEAAFEDMPKGKGPDRPHFQPRYEPQTLGVKRPVQQTYSAVGFPTPPANHADHEALDLLAAVLGDGRSSRLVQTLREKKKVVWSVSSANYGHEGPGIFAVFAETTSENQKRLLPEIKKLFSEVRRKPFTAKEVQRAQNLIQSAWYQGFETYHQQASIIGLYALDNQLDRLEKYLPRLMALTPKDVADVAHRYLDAMPLSLAHVGANS